MGLLFFRTDEIVGILMDGQRQPFDFGLQQFRSGRRDFAGMFLADMQAGGRLRVQVDHEGVNLDLAGSSQIFRLGSEFTKSSPRGYRQQKRARPFDLTL